MATSVVQQSGQYENQAADIRTDPNSSTLLGSLPSDVVVEIMLIARDESIDLPFVQRYRWIYITHIFRYWRTIALQTPILWSILYISPLSLSWQRELLDRTKGAPLSRKERALHHYFTTGIAHTLKLMVSVRANDWSQQDSKTLQQAVQSGAPLLQDLSLVGKVYIPPCIFKNSTPSLRHLTLHDCTFPWDEFPLQADLFSLDINCPTKDPTWSQLRQVLSCMPSLRNLVLHHTLPRIETQMDTSGHLRLPDLQTLDVVDRATSTSVLFDTLSFPASASVTISLFGRGFTQVHLLRAFNTFYTNHSPSITLHQSPVLINFVYGRDRTHITIVLEDGRRVFEYCAYNGGERNDTVIESILSLLQLFPLTEVRTINVDTYQDLFQRVKAL